jgi:hypothetical protein
MPAPKKSSRPKARPFKDVSPSAEEDDQLLVKKKSTKKMAKGGMVARGMGAATKGGKFTRSC